MKFSELPNEEQKKIINKLNSIKGILIESDSKYVELYVNWILKLLIDSKHNTKEIEYNHQINQLRKNNISENQNLIHDLCNKRSKIRAKNYPYNKKEAFTKGDIVHVNFGFGYCDETNDGHYGIILANSLGTMYLIAPLSSRKPSGVLERLNAITYFEGLNLPSKENKNISYVEYNQIRFVHFRRLEFFGNREKEHISIDKVDDILKIFNRILQDSIDKPKKIAYTVNSKSKI